MERFKHASDFDGALLNIRKDADMKAAFSQRLFYNSRTPFLHKRKGLATKDNNDDLLALYRGLFGRGFMCECHCESSEQRIWTQCLAIEAKRYPQAEDDSV